MTQNTQPTQQQSNTQQQERKPNEHVGFIFSEHLKITNPKTGEVILNTRCS